jgi:hypothetical protein
MSERMLSKFKGHPLTGGLVARVYLACYEGWKTCYEVAKLVFPLTKPRNSAGRVSAEVRSHLSLFETRLEEVSEFKTRTLIRSKHDPFLHFIKENCEIDSEEEVFLNSYLDSDFRETVGICLNATIKEFPGYLAEDLNALTELSILLTFLLYLGKLYNRYEREGKDFTLSIAKLVMPKLFGDAWEEPEKMLKPLESITQRFPANILDSLYSKLRTTLPDAYKPLAQLIEGLERYIDEVRANPQILRSIINALESIRDSLK